MGEMDRITQNPAVMGGKACIRGMRVTVGMIVGQIGSGTSVDELLAARSSYLHEREHKRELRLESARQSTQIATSTYQDQERGLLFNLRNAFVQTLQAKAFVDGRAKKIRKR